MNDPKLVDNVVNFEIRTSEDELEVPDPDEFREIHGYEIDEDEDPSPAA